MEFIRSAAPYEIDPDAWRSHDELKTFTLVSESLAQIFKILEYLYKNYTFWIRISIVAYFGLGLRY